MAEIMISSPSLTFLRPHELDTRLIASVVPRTKMSSLVVLEFRKRFVGRGGALAQFVHSAMDIGAVDFVELSNGVDYCRGLLGGSGGVEVNEGPTVDRLLEDREIFADSFYVETGRDGASERAHGISQRGTFPVARGGPGP